MIYLKKSSRDLELKIIVSEYDFYTTCPACGTEVKIGPQDLIEILQEGKFLTTNLICSAECAEIMDPEEEI